MRGLHDIVQDLNCEIWDDLELMSLYCTDSTSVQYIGIHYEGSDIHLWCSEEESFETERELKHHINVELGKLVGRLDLARQILMRSYENKYLNPDRK